MSTNFSIEELTYSSYATRHGIDNTIPAALSTNIAMLAAGLERVRSFLSMPIHVDSGYRCFALNKAIGGASNSAHIQGLAADIICPTYGTPAQIAKVLADNQLTIYFDKLILEGSWVHVAFAPVPKFEILTAHFGKGPTTYTKGLV